MSDCRKQYCKELFELRDKAREEVLPPEKHEEIRLLAEEPVYRFEPTFHMDDDLREHVQDVLVEKLKLAHLKGSSHPGILDDMMAKIKRLEDTIAQRDDTIETLRETKSELEKLIDELRKELARAKADDPSAAKVGDLEARVRELEEENARLKAELLKRGVPAPDSGMAQ